MSPDSTSARQHASTTASVELRDGAVADAERIEAVHFASRAAVYAGKVADWPPPGADRQERVRRWRDWLESPEVECIVASRGNGIVGFCTIRPSRDDDATSSIAEMPTLYVDPSAWGQGLGRALCTAGVRRSTERGFAELTLWVLGINERARGFYDAFGFSPDGVTKIDEGSSEGLVAHRYRLSLR